MRSYQDVFNDISTLLLELTLERLYIFKHVEDNRQYDWKSDASQLMKACDEAARYVSTGLWNSYWEFYESMTRRLMKLPYRLAGSTKNTYLYVLEFQEIDKNQYTQINKEQSDAIF